MDMHPFIKYPGGKTKEIPLVLKYKPSHINKYIEPFVGGGSIYYAINVSNSYINDKSNDLYYLYMLIKKQDEQLKNFLLSFDSCWSKLSNTTISNFKSTEEYIDYNLLIKYYNSAKNKKNKTIEKFQNSGVNVSDEDTQKMEITARKTAFYMLIRNKYNTIKEYNTLRIACFYFLREYCYSSMFRFSSKGDFNVPYGGMSYNEKYLKNKIEYIFSNDMQLYMKKTVIKNEDFESFINSIKLCNDDFIFLDPPYDTDFSTYDNNPFDKNEQIRLRNCLIKTPSKWMLIIKKTDFIFELYKEFNIYEYDINYMVSFKNRNDKDAKHLLITNYEIKEDNING